MTRATLAIIAVFASIFATAETNRTATENWTRNRIAAATNGLATVAYVESKADKATTLAGYGITDAVPLVEDVNGEKTAVTVGTRGIGETVGQYSIANGNNVTALGVYSHAEGSGTTASAFYSHAEGGGTTASGYYSHADGYIARAKDDYAYSWNGNYKTDIQYDSHGPGTFNVNPVGGLDGFYIGEKTLSEAISDGVAGKADTTNVYTKSEVDAKVENAVLPTNPTFSNAVLSVSLNIDTNSVAVLNEIAATFGGFPIEGTATTIGGLLAALAAAVAWLRKKKIDKLTVTGMSKEVTADGGVAKLDDFFTESNSLLTATIDARLPYPLYAVPSTGILKDRTLNTTSIASVTVPDNFTDLLIRASVASSLSVTMPESIATKYGDTFPAEAGEYLITITKTGASEAYVRTIKLEVANA